MDEHKVSKLDIMLLAFLVADITLQITTLAYGCNNIGRTKEAIDRLQSWYNNESRPVYQPARYSYARRNLWTGADLDKFKSMATRNYTRKLVETTQGPRYFNSSTQYPNVTRLEQNLQTNTTTSRPVTEQVRDGWTTRRTTGSGLPSTAA